MVLSRSEISFLTFWLHKYVREMHATKNFTKYHTLHEIYTTWHNTLPRASGRTGVCVSSSFSSVNLLNLSQFKEFITKVHGVTRMMGRDSGKSLGVRVNYATACEYVRKVRELVITWSNRNESRKQHEQKVQQHEHQHEQKVQQHEQKVQQHEQKVQQHEQKVQQHEQKVQQHELENAKREEDTLQTQQTNSTTVSSPRTMNSDEKTTFIEKQFMNEDGYLSEKSLFQKFGNYQRLCDTNSALPRWSNTPLLCSWDTRNSSITWKHIKNFMARKSYNWRTPKAWNKPENHSSWFSRISNRDSENGWYITSDFGKGKERRQIHSLFVTIEKKMEDITDLVSADIPLKTRKLPHNAINYHFRKLTNANEKKRKLSNIEVEEQPIRPYRPSLTSNNQLTPDGELEEGEWPEGTTPFHC